MANVSPLCMLKDLHFHTFYLFAWLHSAQEALVVSKYMSIAPIFFIIFSLNLYPSLLGLLEGFYSYFAGVLFEFHGFILMLCFSLGCCSSLYTLNFHGEILPFLRINTQRIFQIWNTYLCMSFEHKIFYLKLSFSCSSNH